MSALIKSQFRNTFSGLFCTFISASLFSQNIAVNTTGAAAAAANLFEVTQPAGAANNSVGIFASHLGTAANAYAIWAEATGATNKYALVVPAGKGSAGIGTIAPQNTLHVLSDIPNTTTNLHPYRTGIMVEGDQNTFGGRVAIRQAGTNPCMTLYRNNGTIAVPTTLISGDVIGNLAFGGFDGSAVIASPGITAEAAETWAPTDHGWHLTFNTVNIGSNGSSEKMRLTSEGKVGIGTTGPDGLLQVASVSGIGRQIIAGGPTVWSKGWADMSSNVSGDGVFGGNMYTDWNPATYRYSETHGSIGAMGFAVNYPGDSQASVITSGTTSSTAGTSFTPTAIAVFDYSGKVSIGTTSLASRLYVRDNTSRQIAAYDWLDMSSTGGGYGMVGGNAYMNWSDNTFRYSQSHGSIGSIGLVTNYPSWNQASIFSSGTTSSTGGSSFTPTLVAVFDYSGKVGIGTPSPATKLDVQGTSGTTLKIVDGNQGAGKVLTSDAAGVASWTSGSGSTGGFSNMVIKERADDGVAWTCPAGVTKIMVEVWGAGGGGSDGAINNGGAGGGAGGFCRAFLTVVPGTSYAITVGAGGAANTANVAGTSTFGTTLLSASGGIGAGIGGTNGGNGGAGGTCLTAGALPITGGTGQGGESSGQGGNGGSSGNGGSGGGGGYKTAGAGYTGVVPGGGGGGGGYNGTGGTGAAGANGRIVIYY